MTVASDYLRNKILIPSELRTREWEQRRLESWILERGMVMAGTTRYEDLSANRAAAAVLVEGQVTEAEARRQLRQTLADTGYQPSPGTEGTIKDLRTSRRMDATLRTNADMARGYADHLRLVGDTDYPASELHRNRQAAEPRDWDKRWAEASAAVGGVGVASKGMIALNDSPIWAALSRWGNPYPPYDFGSGMWRRPVKRSIAISLGILTQSDIDRIAGQVPDSLNAATAIPAEVKEQDLRDALADQLQGIAEWDGDTLRLVDRNGSRPYDADEIGGIITAPAADGAPESLQTHYQAAALSDYLASPEAYQVTPPADIARANLDSIQDMAMLMQRINPDPATPTLTAGVSLTRAEIEAIATTGQYAVPRTRLGLSAGLSLPADAGNARLVINGSVTARRIDSAAQSVGVDTPITHILPGGSRYRIDRIDTSTTPATIHMTEI